MLVAQLFPRPQLLLVLPPGAIGTDTNLVSLREK